MVLIPVAQRKPTVCTGKSHKVIRFTKELITAVQEYRKMYRRTSPREKALLSKVHSLLIKNPTKEPQRKDNAFAAPTGIPDARKI